MSSTTSVDATTSEAITPGEILLLFFFAGPWVAQLSVVFRTAKWLCIQHVDIVHSDHSGNAMPNQPHT